MTLRRALGGLVSVTATTGFIAHLSSGLAFDSVDVLGADTNAYIRDTAVAADGSLIVVGNFSGSVDFDTDSTAELDVIANWI